MNRTIARLPEPDTKPASLRGVLPQACVPARRRRDGMFAAWLPALLALALTGCGGEDLVELPVEVLETGPVALSVEAEGELRAVKATPLTVPGEPWSQRQLTWMMAEGTRVQAGELIARFSAEQGKLELEKALLDIQRNALARAAKETDLGTGQGRVGVDLAQVGTELAIAQRYAGADLDMFARNEILDAIQNEQFLGVKQDVLEWRRDQSSARGASELAVLDSQRATFELTAERKQSDLEALELRAPHDGVLVLESNWSGEKPRVGASMWAGNEFGRLPDLADLEVRLVLPQIEAQGLAEGNRVLLHPAGRPDQAIETTLSWIASASQTRSRESPVKYVSMKAPVPAEAVTRLGLVPGQAFRARIFIAASDQGLTVPNVAVRSEQGETVVYVRNGDGFERRVIALGERGIARSVVTAGLEPGEAVRLAHPEAGA